MGRRQRVRRVQVWPGDGKPGKPKHAMLTLHFLHPFDDGTLTAELDPDLTPATIVKKLIESKFLEDEAGIYYYLAARHGKKFDSSKPIRDCGVTDGSEVRVVAFEENA